MLLFWSLMPIATLFHLSLQHEHSDRREAVRLVGRIDKERNKKVTELKIKLNLLKNFNTQCKIIEQKKQFKLTRSF